MEKDKTILFFDGECMLCNTFIQFVLKRELKQDLFFAPLQSETAKKVLSNFNIDPKENSTVYLYQNKMVSDRSTAVLKTMKMIKGWTWAYAFILIPQSLRDLVYKWVANNRYRWFGKKDHCELLPAKLTAGRILG